MKFEPLSRIFASSVANRPLAASQGSPASGQRRTKFTVRLLSPKSHVFLC
jgi:hypothetical protein